VIVYSKELKK